MEIDQFLSELLTKRNRDYLTLRAVRDAMPTSMLQRLDLKKGKSSAQEVIEKLRPFLKDALKEFPGSRTVYLGYNLTIEALIVRKLAQSPTLSSKQLRNQLPVNNRDFIIAINQLLSSAHITCALSEKTHQPMSFAIASRVEPVDPVVSNNDAIQFENALKKIGNGQHFVRIHQIRDFLHWPPHRFDAVLERLKSELVIQLQGGDPMLLTEEELKKSYVDQKGRVRITVNWIK